MRVQYVFDFDHAHERPPRELRDLLGGKGANLAEMTSVLGLPVPPGFTVSTEACRRYMAEGWPEGLQEEIAEHLRRLEERMGRRLGDPDDPLLVSVRSGARFSMPGMMDTVLDLGLNQRSVEGLARQTSDRRFALDSYRRFVQMYGRIVLGVDGEEFDAIFEEERLGAGASGDAEIPPETLERIVDRYLRLVSERTGRPFPEDPWEQLLGATEAVFRSWDSPRAKAYRRREGIPDHFGTAVNVQVMVFGNRDDRSGTGVGFTRNPATGDPGAYGDFLVNAQGEDVVAGIRETLPLEAMGELFPDAYRELLEIFDRLERHYRDMMDVEFTIEQDRLWILQTRVGKRTGLAAVRLAVAMHDDPKIRLAPAEAVARVTPEHVDQLLHPRFEKLDRPVLTKGLAASPGAAVGRVYFTADEAAEAAERGEKVILVREETSPEDVHGMAAAEGILTAKGGLVSHAAVVARGWGKPAVVGASEVEIGEDHFRVSETVVRRGDVLSIDGSTGVVVVGELPLAEGTVPDELEVILRWADEVRAGKLGVRANADTAEDARRARQFGAEGIGLARTEHMFLGDRLPVVRRAILADDPDEEASALAELRELQRGDFVGLLEAMDGLPVTIRLLDPPLHEFLPPLEELLVARAQGRLGDEESRLFDAVRQWTEANPMLGIRGVRLGILRPGIYRMQARAIAEAVAERKNAGGDPRVEIMIPLSVCAAELDLVGGWVREELEEVLGPDVAAEIPIGTMIETPRAALVADEIARVAAFFSFGTNDLTQMTFGFSRDDVEGPLMDTYQRLGVLTENPFETVDRDAVGWLVQRACELGRPARGDLKLGVCGEHGGDPASIEFFRRAGVDYVSCSPFRVPVARLAAAQAILGEAEDTGV